MPAVLLKPRWLTGHVLVVGFTAAFVALGFWQLGRHFDQKEANVLVEARIEAPPTGLRLPISDPEELELRQATVRGSYDYAAQLELRPRAQGGRVGYDQVVPLVTVDGVVLVNRGFIADADGSARLNPPTVAALEVVGTVRLSQGTSRFGPQNPEEGMLDSIARIDLDRLNSQFGGPLYPVYLDLVREQPEGGGLPTVIPARPEPTSRPHLPYALQWWAFAATVSIGWVLYLRKQFFTS
jgi:cytochrome oxidase assembly protein ShyY1